MDDSNLWSNLGDRFYRSACLFDDTFPDDFELSHCLVAGALFGGAIAIHRKPSPFHPNLSSQIEVYNGAKRLILTIPWDKGPITALGWSVTEQLIIVPKDGLVRCYNEILGDFHVFRLWTEGEANSVLSCSFYSTGFVALLEDRALVHIADYSDPRIINLAPVPPGEIHAWALVPLPQQFEVLVAIDSAIYLIDASSALKQNIQGGPFRHICVSPNGELVALYTADGRVLQTQSDLMANWYKESGLKIKDAPAKMLWCGNHAPMLIWEDKAMIVGPSDLSITYRYDSDIAPMADSDGIRILSNEGLFFIQRVPEEVENIFRLGSRKPGAILMMSFEQLSGKSHKSHNGLGLIQDSLETAVEECVKAASHEFNPKLQKKLLFSASFGKSALNVYDSDEFVQMYTTLRVLNAVREPEVGMTITFNQLAALGTERLIARLARRHLYPLALKISEYLNLPTDHIYSHWAIQKVKTATESDEKICRAIIDRLRDRQNISFVEIAVAAFSQGRINIATELLALEPRSGDQVQLLLDMGEDSLALQRALESADTDLIYHVFNKMHKKSTRSGFLTKVSDQNVPLPLIEQWAQSQGADFLHALYHLQDRPDCIAEMALREAVTCDMTRLESAAAALNDSKYGLQPQYAFHRKAISEMQKLQDMQIKLEDVVNTRGSRHHRGDGGTAAGTSLARTRLVGLSLYDSIVELIKIGEYNRAQLLQSTFSVPDAAYWRLQLQALVAVRNWVKLADFVETKRSPITWEPFFEEISNAGNLDLAGKFIKKCAGVVPGQRMVDMYMMCGMAAEAVTEAIGLNDRNLVMEVRKKFAHNDESRAEIQRVLAKKGWK